MLAGYLFKEGLIVQWGGCSAGGFCISSFNVSLSSSELVPFLGSLHLATEGCRGKKMQTSQPIMGQFWWVILTLEFPIRFSEASQFNFFLPNPASYFFLQVLIPNTHLLPYPQVQPLLLEDPNCTKINCNFIFWGSKITADGDCNHEMKSCLLLGRKVMTNPDSILKSRDIALPTKVCLVKSMVFPVVMYGCESWTIKKAECQKMDALELWCWRRLLRFS